MDGCVDEWMNERVDGQVKGWMGWWIFGWMDRQVDGWTGGWMDMYGCMGGWTSPRTTLGAFI